jgi:hypothetical protein
MHQQTKLTPEHTRYTRTPEYQQQIQQLISRDAENKRWARLMLQEIDVAIQNDDYQSYVFFVREYENIPKEIVPEHLRNEPGYEQPITELEHYFRIEVFLPAYENPNPYRPIPVYAE